MTALLSDEQRAVKHQLYPDLTDEEFIYKVCNEGCVLPEHKIDGQPWHLPAAWLGFDHMVHAYRPAGEEPQLGWKRVKYLFVLPFPHPSDVENKTALAPNTKLGKFLRGEMERAGIDKKDVIATHLVRFALPEHMKSPLTQHKTAGKGLVIADIENIKPDVVVLFGADTVKAIFGVGTKMDAVRGEVLQYTCEDGTTIPVVPAGSPLQFLGGYADISVFRLELRRAKEIADGAYTREVGPTAYRYIDTVQGVKDLIAELSDLGLRHVAYDTEFGNDVAREEFTYTLSIQLAWGKGKAAFIALRKQEEATRTKIIKKRKKETVVEEQYTRTGIPVFSPEDEAEIWRLVADFLRRVPRVDAHHLRVDVEQAFRNGQDIDEVVSRGFDTMLVHHLLYGDESQGLDYLTHKYLPQYGAYWRELEEWLTGAGRKAHLRFGYRDIPTYILFPYGCKDVDTTWQLAEKLEAELEDIPELKHLYWSLVAPTSQALLEMERHGLQVDEERRMELRELYQPVYEGLCDKLRAMIRWPTFKPSSKDQLAYLLFSSTEYKNKETGEKAYRAALAAGYDPKLLNLTPLLNTDKYPRQWEDIERRGEQSKHTPSTKAITIDLMVQAYPDEPALAVLKQLSVVGKFLSTYLRPVELNEFGVPKGGKGFHQNIGADGRVRTRISQLTETGRYTSKSANLQTCLTGDHEVLTRERGWVRLDEFTPDLAVLQWHPDGTGTFVSKVDYHVYEHSGALIEFKHDYVNAVCTEAHRWPVVRTDSGRVSDVSAAELVDLRKAKRAFAAAARGAGHGLPITNAQLKFLVALQADGSLQRSDHGFDFSFHKPRKIEQFKQLMKELGVAWRDYSGPSYKTTFAVGAKYRFRAYVKDEALWQLAERYLGPEKTLGWWVLDLNEAQLEIFCNELFNWDGLSTRRNLYNSAVKVNVDVVQAAFTRLGRRAAVTSIERVFEPSGKPTTLYSCYIAKLGTTGIDTLRSRRFTADTKVYCLTVPSSYFVARRNGQVFVTGNSPKKQEPLIRAAYVEHTLGISMKEYDKRTFDGKRNKKTGEWEKPPYDGPDRIEPVDRLPHYLFKSCYVAPPGYKLIEADFKTAELFVWAYSSDDKEFINVVSGGRDLHSEVAAIHFNLPEKESLLQILADMKANNGGKANAAYKEWEANFKKTRETERVSAKAVVFGLAYGRGANALSRALAQAGNPATPEQCQKIIDGFAQTFPAAWAWIKKNQDSAVTNGFVQTPFGRRRYFSGIQHMSDDLKAAARREASNAPIQSVVSDLLSQAIVSFYRLKKQTDIGKILDFRVILPIHDALLFEVREDQVDMFIPIIKLCMGTMNKIPRTDYYLDVDVEVMERWGEKH